MIFLHHWLLFLFVFLKLTALLSVTLCLQTNSTQEVVLIADVILWCSSFYTSGQHVVIETTFPFYAATYNLKNVNARVCQVRKVRLNGSAIIVFLGFCQEIWAVSFQHLRFLHFAVVNTSAYASLNKATTSLRLLEVAIKKNKNNLPQNRHSQRLQPCVLGVVWPHCPLTAAATVEQFFSCSSLFYFLTSCSQSYPGSHRNDHLQAPINCSHLFNTVVNGLSLFTDRKADSSRPRKWSHQPPLPSLSSASSPSPSLSLSLSLCLTGFLNRHIPLYLNKNKLSSPLLAIGFTSIQTKTLEEKMW